MIEKNHSVYYFYLVNKFHLANQRINLLDKLVAVFVLEKTLNWINISTKVFE